MKAITQSAIEFIAKHPIAEGISGQPQWLARQNWRRQHCTLSRWRSDTCHRLDSEILAHRLQDAVLECWLRSIPDDDAGPGAATVLKTTGMPIVEVQLLLDQWSDMTARGAARDAYDAARNRAGDDFAVHHDAARFLAECDAAGGI